MSKRINWTKKVQDLADQMRKDFKAANQRMVRIERYSDPNSKQYKREYRHMKDYAYRIAQRNISNITGKQGDKLRFKEKVTASKDQEKAKAQYYDLLKMQKAAEQFLGSASSTLKKVGKKPGLIDVSDKRTNTINDKFVKNFGLEGFTEPELSKFFESKKFEKLKTQYGSQQMFQVAAVVNKLPTSKKEIADYLMHHIDLDSISMQDLQDQDLLSKDQIIDILDDANRISDLRKLMHFVEFTDSEILNDTIASAIDELKLTKSNLFA